MLTYTKRCHSVGFSFTPRPHREPPTASVTNVPTTEQRYRITETHREAFSRSVHEWTVLKRLCILVCKRVDVPTRSLPFIPLDPFPCPRKEGRTEDQKEEEETPFAASPSASSQSKQTFEGVYQGWSRKDPPVDRTYTSIESS